MSKRITMISFMNKTELDKIEKLMNNIQIKTCKVPYGIDENRYNIDNLPYHFTIFATNKENQNEMIDIAQKIDIGKIKVMTRFQNWKTKLRIVLSHSIQSLIDQHYMIIQEI